MKEYLEIEIFEGVYVCGEQNRVVFKFDREVYPQSYRAYQIYTKDGIKHVTDLLEEVVHDVWPGLEPKAATSLGSDCYEYYDKELENNGYLTLWARSFGLESPDKEHERAFVLNKRKAQDLLHTIQMMRECDFS